jgi:hypothetical protein
MTEQKAYILVFVQELLKKSKNVFGKQKQYKQCIFTI